MKTKLLILATMCFTLAGFSQKTELKAADKALKSGDATSAQASLDGIQGMISGTDAKTQAEYYFLRGKTYADLAKKGNSDAFDEAITSFKKVISIEGDKGGKYTDETNQRIAAITADLVNSAVEDNNKKDFLSAAEKLHLSYTLSPKDTVYLYYAASSAVNGGHYEEALGYYEELRDQY
jgi:tetratricopeptide (TPR) repeat protein